MRNKPLHQAPIYHVEVQDFIFYSNSNLLPGEKATIIKQYEVGNFAVFSYLIGDQETKEGLFIDPADDLDHLLTEAKSHDIPPF